MSNLDLMTLNQLKASPKKVLNKMLKCIFSFTNIIFIYLSKKSKSTQWGQQKNKPIKCNYVEKNCHQTQWGKNKALISSTSIQLTFQMAFFFY